MCANCRRVFFSTLPRVRNKRCYNVPISFVTCLSVRKRLGRFPLILYGEVYQNLQQTHTNFDHSRTHIRNMAEGSTCASGLISTGLLRKYLTEHKTVPGTSYRYELSNLHNKYTIQDNSTQATFMMPIRKSRIHSFRSGY